MAYSCNPYGESLLQLTIPVENPCCSCKLTISVENLCCSCKLTIPVENPYGSCKLTRVRSVAGKARRSSSSSSRSAFPPNPPNRLTHKHNEYMTTHTTHNTAHTHVTKHTIYTTQHNTHYIHNTHNTLPRLGWCACVGLVVQPEPGFPWGVSRLAASVPSTTEMVKGGTKEMMQPCPVLLHAHLFRCFQAGCRSCAPLSSVSHTTIPMENPYRSCKLNTCSAAPNQVSHFPAEAEWLMPPYTAVEFVREREETLVVAGASSWPYSCNPVDNPYSCNPRG